MEQARADFLCPVLDRSKPFAEIERGMASFAMFLVDANIGSASPADPSQPAEQLVSVHALNSRPLSVRLSRSFARQLGGSGAVSLIGLSSPHAAASFRP
jgi:hypothetical protein